MHKLFLCRLIWGGFILNVVRYTLIMKIWEFLLSCCVGSVFASCSVSTSYGVYSWENSNAMMIENSVPCDDVVYLLDSVLTSRDRLVVVSEETRSTGDSPLLSGIEAQLIKKLVSNGVVVLERDKDLITKMVAESGERYTLVNAEKYRYSGVSSSEISGGSSAFAGNYMQGNNATYNSSVSGGAETATYGLENWVRRDSTSLLSATRILSYRVIECGIQKQTDGWSNSGSSPREVGRMARTVLDVKLLDAVTSEIILAERVVGVERRLPGEDGVRQGIDPRYRHYSFGRPVQNGNPQMQRVTESEAPPAEKPKAPARVFGFIGLMILAALVL